jgi:hypothetical protein
MGHCGPCVSNSYAITYCVYLCGERDTWWFWRIPLCNAAHHDREETTYRRSRSYNPRMAKAGRNEVCPCGSGKKFKKCCAAAQKKSRSSMLLIGLMVAALAGGVYAAVVGFGDEGSATAGPGRVWSPEHGHYH